MQGNGVLQLQWGNMLQVHDLHEADIVFLETDGACARARVHIKESAQRSHNRAAFRATVAQDVYHSLCQLLLQMKEGGRILSYLDIRKIWDLGPFPFHQLEVNRSLADRFPTSWSVHRGHHFYIWVRVQNKGETRAMAGGLVEAPQSPVSMTQRGSASDMGASFVASSGAARSQETTARSYWFFPPLSSLKGWRSASSDDTSPAIAPGSEPAVAAVCNSALVKRTQVGIDPASNEIDAPQKQLAPDDPTISEAASQQPRQRRQLHPTTSESPSPSGKQHCAVM